MLKNRSNPTAVAEKALRRSSYGHSAPDSRGPAKTDKKQFFESASILNCAVIRRLFVYSILISIALHSAGRLGFIDRVYSNRYEIAVAVGLIPEIPIPLCSRDYDCRKGITAQANDRSEPIPATAPKAERITLFLVSEYSLPLRLNAVVRKQPRLFFMDLYKLVLVDPFFHPPLNSI